MARAPLLLRDTLVPRSRSRGDSRNIYACARTPCIRWPSDAPVLGRGCPGDDLRLRCWQPDYQEPRRPHAAPVSRSAHNWNPRARDLPRGVICRVRKRIVSSTQANVQRIPAAAISRFTSSTQFSTTIGSTSALPISDFTKRNVLPSRATSNCRTEGLPALYGR